MPEFWAIIISVIVLLVIYGIVSSKIKENRQRSKRAKSLPFVDDNVHAGAIYNVFLNDGRQFRECKLIGTSDNSSGQFSIGGWEGMLIIMQSSGKRAFVRQSSVRCIEEA